MSQSFVSYFTFLRHFFESLQYFKTRILFLLHIDLIGTDNADLLGTTLFIGLGLFAGLMMTAILSLKFWRRKRRPYPEPSKVTFL